MTGIARGWDDGRPGLVNSLQAERFRFFFQSEPSGSALARQQTHRNNGSQLKCVPTHAERSRSHPQRPWSVSVVVRSTRPPQLAAFSLAPLPSRHKNFDVGPFSWLPNSPEHRSNKKARTTLARVLWPKCTTIREANRSGKYWQPSFLRASELSNLR